MKPFKILKKTCLLDKPFCKIEQQQVEIPNGEIKDWYVSLGTDSVIIIPLLKDGSVLLQKSYKHGCLDVVIEFPTGSMDQGEKWTDTAPRELLEETGYTAESYTKIGSVFSSPTSSEKQHHIILAKGCVLTQSPEMEDDEQIEPFVVKDIQAVGELLTDPETKTSSSTVAALGYAMCHI